MAPVRWDDETEDVIGGDITAALAYVSRAGLMRHAYRSQLIGLDTAQHGFLAKRGLKKARRARAAVAAS